MMRMLYSPYFPGTGVAGVLKVAGHVLLSVEVIRFHSKLLSSRRRDLHGFVGVVKHGDAVLLDPLVQAGCTLDGQGNERSGSPGATSTILSNNGGVCAGVYFFFETCQEGKVNKNTSYSVAYR